MNMWICICIGSLLIVFTILVHASATRFVLYLIEKPVREKKILRDFTKVFMLSKLVLIMFFASIIESVLWAVTYMWVGAIEIFEDAFYFSIVTYTTLGYGDITLSSTYRLLSSFEAANGIIIFGWSTAIIIAGIQKIYFANSNTSN